MNDPRQSAGGADQIDDGLVGTSQPFVGRWNQLVSTTNWEKGRIITQWREALIDQESPATAYSDEAWAILVGGVTGQHVGRLRRVYQRFGPSHEQYEELFWSHFQAALDWEDAEMWLEGGVQNNWSVSQMRRQRWETLGSVESDEPQEEDVIKSELDEDFEPALDQSPQGKAVEGSYSEVQQVAADGPRHDGPDFGDEKGADDGSNSTHGTAKEDGATIYAGDDERETIDFVRPFANLAELPTDLTAAFDAFKLAVLFHKNEGWQQVTRDDVLASLDALKALALAPSADSGPL
jgi:hypothetical protein